LFDVELGSDVAAGTGYKVGDPIIVSHGVSTETILKHDTMPFTVVGILDRTATPIDRSVYITLEGMEAIHMDWGDGAPPRRGEETRPETLRMEDIKIGQITAFLLRTKNRVETLRLQREINVDESEPLMAIIPGVALNELWLGLSYAEDALRVVSMFVILVGLLGMLVSLYNSLNERRREMAILRAVGAGPGLILSLMVLESTLLTMLGTVIGVGLTYGSLFAFSPLIESHFGLFVPINFLTGIEMVYLALIVSCGVLLGGIPAWRAYRNTLADGLTIRV
jgi:putative ABC transport system permease protein